MKRFNLSDWALEHRSMVWYFMLIFLAVGISAYFSLGREEDPPFTIRSMLITAQWPGATAEDMSKQVTERIERAVQDLETLKRTKSVTGPGFTSVTVELNDTAKADKVRSTWLEVRAMVDDASADFPSGVRGPAYNDRFGDVYGNIYAFTGDGVTHRQLRDYVEDARSRVLTVKDAGRVEIVGAQDEVVYLDFSTRQLAALGISSSAVLAALQDQNAVSPSGVLQSGGERVAIRVSGQFTSEESLEALNLRVGDQFFRLSDVATIRRGYEDPASTIFRFNGEPAIGLAIGMRQGANLLDFGEALEDEIHAIEADLPVGVEVHLVANQPEVVEEAVNGFTKALFEAVAIVLVVSFVSLGLRAGLVVALSIPLVLAITFAAMLYLDISLQRISLGALIIALGLLVDDAMIAVEMMVSRLEQGASRREAAIAVYTSTAFPMLTGTLVTVAGFTPVGLNSSQAGEFVGSLFVVLAVSLVVSWVVAVLFTPLLGVSILPKTLKVKHAGESRFARMFKSALDWSMRHRWSTIGATVAIFGLAVVGMGSVQQQFFPASDRPELLVDWNLPQNSSIAQTEAQIAQFEREMLADNPDVDHFSSYVGSGAPRFVLTLDVPTAMPSVGQTVIVTKGLEERDRLEAQLADYLRVTFPGTDANIKTIALGPPVGRPIQYRVSGPDVETVRTQALGLASVVQQNANISDVVFDWMEPARTVMVDILYDKARQLGVTADDITSALNSVTSGSTVTQIRDEIYLVDVMGRAGGDERNSISTLENLQISTSGGTIVPLAAVATFRYQLEQPLIMRRDRVPTITVGAGIASDLQPATVAEQLTPAVDAYLAQLPAGYHIEVGGEVESSAESQAPIIAAVPLMLFAMATILMIQLQSFSRLFLVFAVAPLAIIGVVAALLLFDKPLGFVALLGVLALVGILIRNSVILIIQIEQLRKDGMDPWHAVIEATQHRFRPILLTALAASLGLIPIAAEVFWGPMALAMIGGIVVGTALTLVVLPALYVAWFRIQPPSAEATLAMPDATATPAEA